MSIYDLFFISQDLFTHPVIVEVQCKHSWTKWPCRIHSTTCEADLQIKIHRTTTVWVSCQIQTSCQISPYLFWGKQAVHLCFRKKLNYAVKYVQLFIDLNYVPFQEIRNNIKQGTRRRITGNKAQETTTCNRNETEHRTERTQCLNTQGVLFGAWWDQQVTEESGKYLLPFP